MTTERPDPCWITPDWPAPPGVRALITSRAGGASLPPFAAADGSGGMNLGFSEPDPAAARNRAALARWLPRDPCWLRQVHGAHVVDADHALPGALPEGDASVSARPGVVCCVLTADCLPVLLTDAQGRAVAAVHAGWRGLAAGVIQNTVRALRAAAADPRARVLAWLGPAIGPQRFEVGPEVRTAMRTLLPDADRAFAPGHGDRLLADIYALARQALAREDVADEDVQGGGLCTMSDARFYSYRRDGVTGRQAALIWIEDGRAGQLGADGYHSGRRT